MVKRRPSKKQDILHAAGKLTAEQGAAQLTLEAVAQAAGVSKGGLLYHFPDKETLIRGMVELFLDEFEERLAEVLAHTSEPERGRWLRTYVRCSFELGDPPTQSTIVTAGLAAIANYPDLLQIIQARFEAWYQRGAHDGIPVETAHMIMLATDGLWYADMFGIRLMHGTARRKLLDRLLHMIDTA